MRRNNTTGKGREFLNMMGTWHGMKANKVYELPVCYLQTGDLKHQRLT